MQLYILVWSQKFSIDQGVLPSQTNPVWLVSLAFYCLWWDKQYGRVENPSQMTGPLHIDIKLLLVGWTLLSTMSHLRYYKRVEILQRTIFRQQTEKFEFLISILFVLDIIVGNRKLYQLQCRAGWCGLIWYCDIVWLYRDTQYISRLGMGQ